MRITQEADYALRILFCLAKRKEKTDATTLATLVGITPRFALKILRKLNLEGLVESYKGACGGYMLAREAGEISLKDAIEAIDGPIMLNKCLDDGYECSRMGKAKDFCSVHCVFCRINADLSQKFSSVSIKDLIDDDFNIENLKLD